MIATDMKAPSPDFQSDPDDSGDDTVSKSQRKRDMTALQALGEALVDLPADQLAAFDLPESLHAAIREAQRVRKFGALRRQLQYVGKLMRHVDPVPIRARLDALQGVSKAHIAWLHRLEHWRDRLMADPDALTALVAEHPEADAAHLRTLLRNARRERDAGKPPKAYREIFQILRELIPETSASTEPEPSEESP